MYFYLLDNYNSQHLFFLILNMKIPVSTYDLYYLFDNLIIHNLFNEILIYN